MARPQAKPDHRVHNPITLRRLSFAVILIGAIGGNHERLVYIAARDSARERRALQALPINDNVEFDRVVPFGVLEFLVEDPEIFDRVVSYGIPQQQQPLRDASQLRAFRELRVLNLSDTRFNETDLSTIFPLKNLEELRLVGTSVTDAFINALEDCTRLSYLSLSYSKVSPKGIARLCTFDLPLRELSLAGLDVGDEEVRKISDRYDRLHFLNLCDTKVTPKCLATLSRLARLRELDLSRTGVRISEPLRSQLQFAGDGQ